MPHYPATYRTSEARMRFLQRHDDIPKSKFDVICACKYSGDCDILNHFVLWFFRPSKAEQAYSEARSQKRNVLFPYPTVSRVRGVQQHSNVYRLHGMIDG